MHGISTFLYKVYERRRKQQGVPNNKLSYTFSTFSLSKDLHRDVEIKAANGKSVKAVKVFAHALKFFKDHVLEELSDQSATRILEEDIQWVLTVPAIWRAPAKQFMRTAAYEVS